MSSINVSKKDKEAFDEWRDQSNSQKESFAELMEIARAFEGDPVDHDELAQALRETLITDVELATVRGCREVLEDYEENNE